jgi:RNA polymerase sigma factor (sigma-70 family)
MTDTSKPNLENLIDQVARQIQPPVPDAHALNQFVQSRDSEAFTLLLERHGPMVLGVCQRILGNQNDAEDAFQATFLKLARGAKSIYRPESLAAWLHRVARQTAGRLKSRRPLTTTEISITPDKSDPYAEVTWREVRSILDREIARLPEELRLPLILCYLEGATRDEAASRLGWSLRTLMRRLQEARETLRDRLTRQGLAPMGLAATILSRDDLVASIPPTLASQTLEFAGGKSIIPDRILALSANNSLKKWFSGIVVSAISIFGLSLIFLTGSSDPKQTDEKKIEQPTEKSGLDLQGDPLPEGSLARLGTLRYRHPNGIGFSSLSKDGKRIATTSLSKHDPYAPEQVMIWELPNGKLIRSFSVQSERTGFIIDPKPIPKFSATISSDNKKAILLFGQDVRIYDIESGKQQKKLTVPESAQTQVVQFSSNLKQLFFFGNRVFRMYDPETEKGSLIPVEGHVKSISDDEKWIIVCNENKTTLIDLDSQKPIRTLELTGCKSCTEATLTADKNRIALVGDNPSAEEKDKGYHYKIELYETKTGKRIQTLLIPNYSVPKAICFTPDGKYLFAAGYGGLYGWNLESNQMTCLNLQNDKFQNIHATPDNKEIIATAEDGLIRRYDIQSMKEIFIEGLYDSEVRSALSSDGKYAVLSDQAGRLDVWDLFANKPYARLKSPDVASNESVERSAILALAFLPNSSLLATRQNNRQFAFWDMASKKPAEQLKFPKSKPSRVPRAIGSFAVSSGGRYLFATDLDGHAWLEAWDLKQGKRLWQIAQEDKIYNYGNTGISALPDGKTIVQTRMNKPTDDSVEEGELIWWEWNPSEPTKSPIASKRATWNQPLGDLYEVLPVAASPCGRYLIVGGRDGIIRMWHPQSNKEITQAKVGLPVRSLAFSPDGKLFASGGSDGKVILWESATMQQVLTRTGHTGWVTHLTFGPGGKTLLSSGHDSTALYWDLRPKVDVVSKSIWEDLASTDSVKAYSVLWQCVDNPKEAIPLFRSKQSSLTSTKSEQIVQWIAKLDAKSFAERELASKSLTEMGQITEPSIRQTLSKNPSSETKDRLEKILDQLRKTLTPTELRDQRMVQILEMIDSPEAKNLLQEWAKHDSNSWLTINAQTALNRLKAN